MKPEQYRTAEYPVQSVSNSPVSPIPLLKRWLRYRLSTLLHQLPLPHQGSLKLSFPDGTQIRHGDNAPIMEIQILNERALRRLMTSGALGWAEAYIKHEWETPDLTALLRWILVNERTFQPILPAKRLPRLIASLLHWHNRNSKRGSRRNIQFHYDLGNAFYRLWLDPSMTYSSALFEGQNCTLEQAQTQKYERICQWLELKPGQSVLEIGCGWGGFAQYAASHYGVKVTGVTLSDEQLAYGKERLKNAGLDRLCDLQLRDYRDISEQYDHVVSIEMFEAVGESHWRGYFDQVRRALKPNGKAVIQVITIDEARFEHYQNHPDFIQRYVFPGGMLPSPERFIASAQQQGLALKQQLDFGQDYAHTLRLWRHDFNQAWNLISQQGFDEPFRRLWLYYLAYCEAGFMEGSIDVSLFELSH